MDDVFYVSDIRIAKLTYCSFALLTYTPFVKVRLFYDLRLVFPIVSMLIIMHQSVYLLSVIQTPFCLF